MKRKKSSDCREGKEKGMRRDLDIVRSAKVEAGANIKATLDESVAVEKIIVERKVLGDEGELRVEDLAIVVVLKRELELGETVEELAGDFVEEDRGVAVELGGESKGGSVGPQPRPRR